MLAKFLMATVQLSVLLMARRVKKKKKRLNYILSYTPNFCTTVIQCTVTEYYISLFTLPCELANCSPVGIKTKLSVLTV